MKLFRPVLLAVLAVLPVAVLRAQDPEQRVKVILQYTPGTRPGLVIVPGPGLDSVRAILRRDLDYSDRFEVVVVPPTAAAPPPTRPGTNGTVIRLPRCVVSPDNYRS